MNTTSKFPKTLLTLALLCAPFTAAQAHGDHDHDDKPTKAATAPAPVTGDKPTRLPDGSVNLSAATQQQLGIRSALTTLEKLPRTQVLNGRVAMDPNAGGKVQALFAGRVEAPAQGLPDLGQPVKRGQTLAWVRASVAPQERAAQDAQVADLRAQLALAQAKAARLQQLAGSVPQREIEAADIELEGLRQRLQAQRAASQGGEPLVAPVSGVIAARHVVAGQVVDAKELLFEIVDPARLIIEADAFDAALVGQIGAAQALPAGAATGVALRWVGAGRTLQNGALPLQFRTVKQTGQAPAPLALGQPLKVLVQTKELLEGVALPPTAVVKNASNLDMVWVQTGPTRFEPRPVRAVQLDGARLTVQDGLKGGERVVVDGAALLRQVR